ncbi:TIGR01906 family membrane protein [Ligilactobacillus acidipiscis]|uniref:TIGR01906 family membrane protein n=1 Tax=Ligilactobacillus acidipiscis TaxID=89059 RepID=UPI000249295E|nr:TIGR01906 family membrane protein [Ligilactobacillus acidipiscis]
MISRSKGQLFLNGVLFLTIFALCIALVINFQPLYYFFVDQQHLAQTVSLTRKGLITDYQHLLNYLNFPWVHKLDMTLPSSANGLQHFADVKRLFLVDYFVMIVGVPLSVYHLHRLKKQQMLWTLIAPAQITLTGMIFLLVLMSISFQQFFVIFHKILFRNNDWVFDPLKDPIIDALPDEFFLACFVLFFILFIAAMLAVIFIGKKSLKTHK